MSWYNLAFLETGDEDNSGGADDSAKAVCVVCLRAFPANRMVYGVPAVDPLGTPDFYCKKDARALNVTEFDLGLERRKGGAGRRKR